MKVKLHVEHPEEGGTKVTKVFINGPGYMTKMATIAINRKNLLKSSSPKTEGKWVPAHWALEEIDGLLVPPGKASNLLTHHLITG